MLATDSLAWRATRAVVWFVALVAAALALATILRTGGGGPVVERVGLASVEQCAEHGPISVYGYGVTYSCDAVVRWSNGEVERRTLGPGGFTRADIGHRVPVYLSVSEGYGGRVTVGRNAGASFWAWYIPGVLAGGLVVLATLIGTISALLRLFRSQRQGQGSKERAERRRREDSKQWELSKDDRAGLAYPKLVRRMFFLVAWAVLAVVLFLLASVPRYSAPRVSEANTYDSPWPQIGEALLVDADANLAAVVFELLAVILLALALSARTNAARVVKYGSAFLGSDTADDAASGTALRAKMDKIAARHAGQRATSVLVATVLAGLAVWAILEFALQIPAQAPPLVLLACARDAILLTSLAGIWFLTLETKHERLRKLLFQHEERHGASDATNRPHSAS